MRKLVLAISCLFSVNTNANVFQFFTGISYSNPAELFKVKNNEFIIGSTEVYVEGRFTGNALNFNTLNLDYGESDTKRTSILPYGRIASRINDKLVWGVDVTQPFNSYLVWGKDAVTRYASIDVLITDVDVSPRLSAEITPKLHAGVGVNFNFLKNNEVNWALPVNATQYATLTNRTTGFGAGYDVGLSYMINPTNFIGASYYSAIRQNTRGQSMFAGNISNDIRFNFRFPATSLFNYTHIFSPTWLGNIQAIRSEWDANQFARVLNTAAPPPAGPNFIFTMKYKPSWAFVGVLRKQVNEKTGLSFLGVVDDGPERDIYRTLNFPADRIYLLGLSTDYHLNQTTSVELLYGHAFYNTLLGNYVTVGNQQMPLTSGRVRINADVIDLRLKVQA
ncbi:OmpP1/FadL family transporter [Legionella dresdenensis]|uniref:OmpP1/FadL family transporter n=1 Tax=Legionella dresdenensis TaxID=450200 RepID=A0ABV8CID0_9GAMM